MGVKAVMKLGNRDISRYLGSLPYMLPLLPKNSLASAAFLPLTSLNYFLSLQCQTPYACIMKKEKEGRKGAREGRRKGGEGREGKMEGGTGCFPSEKPVCFGES